MADTSTQGLLAMLTQLRDLWTRQSKRRKTAAFAVLLGVLGWVGYTTLAHHTDTWTAIADGASPDDSQEMYAMLQSRNIPARLHEGKVEVPEDRADEARAAAASSGLPHSGKGFELFDSNNLGQSSFAEQVNFRRALQGELSRSITALAQVDGARVHLALGRRSVFKEQDEAPSASVALHLHAGQVLTSSQVRGVRELVAASVEGLKADAVVLVDNHGNLLDSNEPNSVDHKAELEHNVTTRVRSMLERVVGPGKVSVVATADVDERKISETEDVYDKDHTAIRSESRTVEGVDAMGNAGSSVGGIAGARGNLPGAPGATANPGTPNGRLQETKNYEVTHTVRQTVTPEAQLQRLHVAIVVDYKTDAKGKPVPRSEQELAELTAVARQAAGIDDTRGDKIELHSIPFAEDPEAVAAAAAANLPPTKAELPLIPIAIGGGAGVLVLFTLIILLARRGKKHREMAQLGGAPLALPAPVAAFERVLDQGPSLDSPPPGLPPGSSVHDRVVQSVRGDAARAASVLTAWLHEPAPAAKGAK